MKRSGTPRRPGTVYDFGVLTPAERGAAVGMIVSRDLVDRSDDRFWDELGELLAAREDPT